NTLEGKEAEVKIDGIKVGKRFRGDLGDIVSLSKSIAAIGLLHPVVVTKDSALVAGRRRLEACKELGWTDIPTTVVDLDDPLRAEHDENAVRKDFTPSELVGIGEAIDERQRELAKQRQKEHGRTAPGKKKNTSGNLPEVIGDARDATAKA